MTGPPSGAVQTDDAPTRRLVSGTAAAITLEASRRRLVMDGLGIAASAIGFGLVYGLSAREAGFSLVDAIAMSVLVFAGAAQFAAVGAVAQGVGWPAIVLLTAFLNARHLLYSAALAPWVARTGRPTRATMAYLLTDEAFALSIAHFRRIGRFDLRGYWYAAIVTTFIPWNLATIGGVLLGSVIADPGAIGLDVVFPAAMAGLAVGLASGRREIVAAGAGAAIAVLVSLAWAPSGGIIVGGLVGPLLAMLVPAGPTRRMNPVPLGPASELHLTTAEVGGPMGIDTELAKDLGRDPDIGVAP
jgi:4-azaleucine resistance transporter AzlC